jgi:ABC-type phosphate transport system permease subunit
MRSVKLFSTSIGTRLSAEIAATAAVPVGGVCAVLVSEERSNRLGAKGVAEKSSKRI